VEGAAVIPVTLANVGLFLLVAGVATWALVALFTFAGRPAGMATYFDIDIAGTARPRPSNPPPRQRQRLHKRAVSDEAATIRVTHVSAPKHPPRRFTIGAPYISNGRTPR
jgi:hypothetical protein